MEIKVTYQGQVVGVLDFQASTVIAKMRDLGYASFNVRSRVSKYEFFAQFKNEDTDEYIRFFPDKSFIKFDDLRITLEELRIIKNILDYNIIYSDNEEEIEQHEKESD